MKAVDFNRSPIGTLVPAEGVEAFVADPLPRQVELAPALVYLLDEASNLLGALRGVGETLPNPHLLISPFMRREAVLSSRIEGTQASISDVYAYEAVGRGTVPDAREVSNYVRAIERGRDLLGTLPICTRLTLELHAVLLDGVRGEEGRPGELRQRQVWIAPHGTPIEDARFVPPPANLVPALLANWERFVHHDEPMPPLIRCALMHYQFETIHPFLDGNGRIGRLLIPLLLAERDVLPTPLLYLSAYFERHREEYYDHLYRLSSRGDWSEWLRFFLSGVLEQAEDALKRARSLRTLQEEFRARLQAVRASGSAFQLVDELFVRPVFARRHVMEKLGLSSRGAGLVLDRLEAAGIVVAIPSTYPYLYRAEEILRILQ